MFPNFEVLNLYFLSFFFNHMRIGVKASCFLWVTWAVSRERAHAGRVHSLVFFFLHFGALVSRTTLIFHRRDTLSGERPLSIFLPKATHTRRGLLTCAASREEGVFLSTRLVRVSLVDVVVVCPRRHSSIKRHLGGGFAARVCQAPDFGTVAVTLGASRRASTFADERRCVGVAALDDARLVVGFDDGTFVLARRAARELAVERRAQHKDPASRADDAATTTTRGNKTHTRSKDSLLGSKNLEPLCARAAPRFLRLARFLSILSRRKKGVSFDLLAQTRDRLGDARGGARALRVARRLGARGARGGVAVVGVRAGHAATRARLARLGRLRPGGFGLGRGRRRSRRGRDRFQTTPASLAFLSWFLPRVFCCLPREKGSENPLVGSFLSLSRRGGRAVLSFSRQTSPPNVTVLGPDLLFGFERKRVTPLEGPDLCRGLWR